METRAKHFIDLTGQTFGQLTVLQLDKIAKPKGIAYWFCRCDCGKTVSVSRNHLRSGHTKSCGHTHELKDLTGQIFGKLKVLMYDECRPYHWVCRCDCGQFISVSGGALRDGRQRSCGCLKTIKDIRGQRFGRLIALRVRVRVYWECKCDCGQPTTVLGESLRLGLTKSCGCINSERVTKGLRTTHGHNPRRSRSPEYSMWAGMIYRCTNKNALNYSKYGGRGIKVCERWTSFENFLADVGPRPSLTHTLDRIDNDGIYEPGNCRWATNTEQLRNTQRNRLITFNSQTFTLAEWAEKVGIDSRTIAARLDKYHWNLERALTTPLLRGQSKVSTN